ncbi:MAG: DUF1538 domain-containing protein [Symbiobacteriaceae bacterium]|nr:DUF1538 domain-containing protein [Symbiobacteriaceae bacterium]
MKVNPHLKEKIDEAVTAVLPVTIIVLILSFLLVPIETGTLILFLVGALLLIIGMGLFALGTDMAMMPLGEGVGIQLSKTKQLWLVALLCFVMGFFITISEPDLQVLASQVPGIPSLTLIITIAVGVGFFLITAILRILFRVNLNTMLIIFYGILFVASAFVPRAYLAVAFDSGGVTTGPITVPFIMAMGIGLASVRSDKDAADDSFGLVALCSVGPILSVMILGSLAPVGDTHYLGNVIPELWMSNEVIGYFLKALPHVLQEVLIAFGPLVGVFIVFEAFTRRHQRRELIRMAIGFAYTFVGLVLFLTGVSVGFLPVGQEIGFRLASVNPILLVVVGMVIAYFMVAAEPAVHVLNKQVEDLSKGAIPRAVLLQALSLGVAVSIGLSMIRVLTGISIYWLLIPGYLIALVMTFFVPKIYVGIAFDSGGVASGPMATTFLMPLAIGACDALGGDIMMDAFGTVAMVAMTPLIAIQVLGFISTRRAPVLEPQLELAPAYDDDDIIMLTREVNLHDRDQGGDSVIS